MTSLRLPVMLCAALSILPTNATADIVADAFQSCLDIIADNLDPTGQRSDIRFPELSDVNWTEGDEFYFAFPSGTILKASRTSPDWLTGSMDPSASCGGSVTDRTIAWVTINGQDVESYTEGF